VHQIVGESVVPKGEASLGFGSWDLGFGILIGNAEGGTRTPTVLLPPALKLADLLY
jgi:hypothetical protein